MIKKNKAMDEILLKLKKFNRNELLNIKYKNLIEIMFPELVQVNDCIISTQCMSPQHRNSIRVRKEAKDEIDENSNSAFDKIEYEYFYNEILLNNFFEGKISKNALVSIGFTALKSWGAILKKMEPKSKFWMILSCDRKTVMIRFHKQRNGEDLIFEDVDAIEQPVYCELIE